MDLSLVFQALLSLCLLCSVIIGYYLCFVPMNRIRTLDDVGNAHLNLRPKLKKQKINQLRRGREFGNPPPPFPNGWYVLAESREILPGKIQQVSAIGHQFAVFRGTESNKSFVTDAYCPHLGANICVGGTVDNDGVQCPFHLWTFDGQSGECTKIPYADSIPSFAKLKTWTSVEVNELIYVWYHIENLEPSWHPTVLPMINHGCKEQWVYQGRSEYEVSCHIQDIPENGSDIAHLDAVHRSSIVSGGEPSDLVEKLTDWAIHQWTINWKPMAEDDERMKHCSKIQLEHKMTFFGKLDLLKLKVTGYQIGPASVHLHFDSFMGKGVMLQYVLPLEPMKQKLVHVFYTQRSVIPPYAKLILLGESILVERDIRVWNVKMYLHRPLLVKEDRLVSKHRRWYSQFYSPKSITFTDAMKAVNKLDW